MIASPAESSTLWKTYVEGALASYRRFGVEQALEYEKIRDGADTKLFFAVVDEDQTVIGGARTPGRMSEVVDAHAVQEWECQDGAAAVRDLVISRLSAGLLELKSAWVESDRSRAGALTAVLARTPILAMDVLDVPFALATSADHALARWGTSGGVIADNIPATPYPDARYRTRVMSWDRRNFLEKADPAQRQALRKELRILDQYPRAAGVGIRSRAL